MLTWICVEKQLMEFEEMLQWEWIKYSKSDWEIQKISIYLWLGTFNIWMEFLAWMNEWSWEVYCVCLCACECALKHGCISVCVLCTCVVIVILSFFFQFNRAICVSSSEQWHCETLLSYRWTHRTSPRGWTSPSWISPVITQWGPAYEHVSFHYVKTGAESEQPVRAPFYQWVGCRDHAGLVFIDKKANTI